MLVCDYFAPLLDNKLKNITDDLLKEKQSIINKKERIKNAYINEIVSMSEFEETLKELDFKLTDIEQRLKQQQILDNLTFTIEDLQLYRDLVRIGFEKEEWLSEHYVRLKNLTKEQKQSLVMKYIDDIEIIKNGKELEIRQVNFRKSFIYEYADLFRKGILDMPMLVDVNNEETGIGFTIGRTKEEVKHYVSRLKEHYDIKNYESKILIDNDGNITIPMKEDGLLIKLMPIKDDDKISTKSDEIRVEVISI